MASQKIIKNRIRSIRNTKKITKAMELVAASKMKKAVSSTLASRIYAEYSWEILTSLSQNLEEITHPLFTGGIHGKTLVVLISSNRGLCGAYNAQIIRKLIPFLKSRSVDIVSIGRKGDLLVRRLGQNVVATFVLPDHILLRDVAPISNFIIEEYRKTSYREVLVAYTDYVSALTQRPNIKQLLPISKRDLKELLDSLENVAKSLPTSERKINYLIEGEKEKLIGLLAEKLTRMQIYQMLLESQASEQSARMVAMKNASDASGEMIAELTLVFNKARQANITREIAEISAGMASV